MKKGKYTGVEYDLIDVPDLRIDNEIFTKGTKWANPREEDAKKKMRKFVESQAVPRQWASDLGKRIRQDYSFEAVSAIYEKELGDLL